MNTGQTVYEQLQEIKENIADKTLSSGYVYENLGHRQEILLAHETVDDVLYDVRDTQVNGIVRINRNTILLATNHNIGHPISLSRVLSALDYKYKIIPLHDNIEYNYYIDTGKEKSIKRKLLNEDGSDAMLDDQSEQTIEELHKLLVRK